MSTEANLTSHLTISYSAAPTASGTPAAASATASPAADAAAEPSNFLSALIDHLLGGSAVGQAATGTSADPAPATASAPATVIPELLNLGMDAGTASAAAANPRATGLLAKLTDQLKTIRDELDQGKTPGKDELQDLGATLDALVAMLGATTPLAAPPPAPDPAQTLDPLAALGGTTAATPSDQARQYLASLGLPTTPLPQLDAPAATPASGTQPLPAVAELADKLAALSQSLAPLAPDIARKLTALSDKLQSGETDPAMLAQLTTPGDGDGTKLDKLVRDLLGARPAASPAVAANPAAPATPSVTDAVAPAATPATPPVAVAQTAITKLTATAARPATDKDDTVADAKLIAAATDTAGKAASPDPSVATGPATQPAVAAARSIPAAYQAASNPINMNQVAFEMVRQLHQGQSRFTLRIDPPELGRVDVKMHVDAAGNVNARLTVERSETLDMFQRDKGALEKALTQAGLDGSKTNLEFSLRQNPFAGMSGGDRRPGSNSGASTMLASVDSSDDASVPSVVLYQGVASAGGLNLFV